MVMSLYSLLWHLLLPAVWLRLYWRGRKQPGYRQHQAERFGRYAPHAKESMIWLHAVSVGETRAAAPLVKALQRDYPTHRLLLTVMTPTGRETAQQLFGDSVELVRVGQGIGTGGARVAAIGLDALTLQGGHGGEARGGTGQGVQRLLLEQDGMQ